jgi:hypothetical protein
MALVRGQRLGPYEIVGTLGAGGMGEVYRAVDTRLGRPVALKVLPVAAEADPQRVRRFAAEAQALARLRHPNILTLYEAGSIDGIDYAALELVEGDTLATWLQRGPLPLDGVLDIGRQVALGLAAAHAQGVLHRDVKPANVMVMPDGVVKLLDFGLARAMSVAGGETVTVEQLTAASAVVGTAGYMAPEQVRGDAVDARTDVFGLGVLLYEMASGARPFARSSVADVHAAVLRDPPPPLPATVPAPLRKVIARCLEKRPASRFASAADVALLLDAVDDWREEPGVVGRPVWTRRWRAVAALALIAGLAASVSWGSRATNPSLDIGAPQRLTYRRGAVFEARFVPGGGVAFSAAWDGQPVDVYEATSGRDARARGLPGSQLLAVGRSGDLALVHDARPFVGGYPLGRLALVQPSGRTRDLAANVTAADFSPTGPPALAIGRRLDSGEWAIEWPQGREVYRSRLPVSYVRVAPNGDLGWLENDSVLRTRVMWRPNDGAPQVLVTQAISPGGLAWSPDGAELWYTAPRTATLDDSEIHAVSRTGAVRPLLRQAGSLRLLDAASDGRVLVAVSRTSAELQIADVRGVRSTGWLGSSYLRDLSADGRWVLFSEDGPGGFDLYLRRTDGSPAVRVAEGLDFNVARLSPDASRVALLDGDATVIQPVAAGARRVIAERLRPSAWLPDGRTLVAWSAQAYDGQPVTLDVDAGQPTPRVLDGVICRSDPVVSIPGRRLACLNGSRLVVHELGGEARAVELAGAPGNLAGWSADERTIFAYEQGRVPQFVRRIDVQTGAVTDGARLTPPDATGVWRIQPVRVTPDGNTVAYTVSRRLDEAYLYPRLP